MRFIYLFVCLVFFYSCSFPGQLSDREINSHKIIKEFVNKMNKKGLRAIGAGGGELEGKTTQISVTFTTDQELNIQTGRVLIINTVCEVLNLINSKKNIEHFFEEFPVSNKIIRVGILGKEIRTTDENYIHTVCTLKGMIYYFTNDPNPNIKRSKTAHEETFEEAKRIVCEQQESYPSQF